eukprot:4216470-Prymnesium_polylepis.1
MLAPFKSRWITPLLCRYIKPSSSIQKYAHACNREEWYALISCEGVRTAARARACVRVWHWREALTAQSRPAPAAARCRRAVRGAR